MAISMSATFTSADFASTFMEEESKFVIFFREHYIRILSGITVFHVVPQSLNADLIFFRYLKSTDDFPC